MDNRNNSYHGGFGTLKYNFYYENISYILDIEPVIINTTIHIEFLVILLQAFLFEGKQNIIDRDRWP